MSVEGSPTSSGQTGDAPACRLCRMPVIANRESYEIFESMHYVCFHLVFEHEGDVDEACDVPGCPIAPRSVVTMREALRWYRHALRTGEPEDDELRRWGNEALGTEGDASEGDEH